jgi:hypothetical protein
MVITVGQGAYRGLKKLRTTMVISMLVAGTNMVLDPLLMFNFKLGLGESLGNSRHWFPIRYFPIRCPSDNKKRSKI